MIKCSTIIAQAALTFILSLSAGLAYAESQQQTFSHQLFDNVLRKYVDNGSVDYPSIQVSADYHNYIDALADDAVFDNSNEELSYWINAYNALAIKGILDDRSPDSFFGRIGYFYNAEHKVNGITTNLYDLEHEIIIPLGEPRIHFALNCASASCPLLRNETYQTEKLESQLEDAATRFINDETRNRFDYDSRTAYLSKIFEWFANDFASHSGSVQNYLALYIEDKKVSNALAKNEFNIEYLEYDWSLNGTAPSFED